MKVGSLFSGIGGMDAGLARVGFEHVFFCESESYRRDVLRARFPGVPVYDDVRTLFRGEPARGATSVRDSAATDNGGGQTGPGVSMRLDELGTVQLLCGGFPCQDLSVAGKRAGLAGERSGLFFEFARVIGTVRPRWVLLENVPGLLSSNGGRDFGVVLETLADLGYGVAWRVVDSRFFGVPQRRRRVFILGAVADGDSRTAAERAGEVLAVGSRCERHLAARGEAREGVAHTLTRGSGSSSWKGADHEDYVVAETLREHPRPGSNSNGQIVVAAPPTKGSASGEGVNAPGRRQEDDVNIIPYRTHIQGGSQQDQFVAPDGVVPTLAHSSNSHQGHHQPKLLDGMGVRRLTPRECERLQGLDDDWTDLGDTSDSRRYSALGDAVTANVAEWIGGRIKEAA